MPGLWSITHGTATDSRGSFIDVCGDCNCRDERLQGKFAPNTTVFEQYDHTASAMVICDRDPKEMPQKTLKKIDAEKANPRKILTFGDDRGEGRGDVGTGGGVSLCGTKHPAEPQSAAS